MSKRPLKEFNSKAKKYLFTVSVGENPKKDYSEKTRNVIESVRKIAEKSGLGDPVQIRPNAALAKAGAFFMNAPEQFADKVRRLEGVISVEKPAARKAAPASRSAIAVSRTKKRQPSF